MKVYELASQMCVISSEVTNVAEALGYGRLGPSDDLSPLQESEVRRLVSAGGFAPPSDPGPVAWAPPGTQLPPPPPGTQLPPPPAASPQGPASSAEWAPSPWAANPPPPSSPPFGAAPPPSGWSAPPPPGALPPPPAGAPLAPPSAWAPPGSSSAPPPDPGFAPPADQLPSTTIHQNTVADPIPASGGRSVDHTQKAMIAGAIAIAIALFAYMAMNIGGDRPTDQAVESASPRPDIPGLVPVSTSPVTTSPPLETTTTPPPTTEAAPETTTMHRHELRDTTRFCRGAGLILPLEMRMAAAATESDWLGVQEEVREGRANWDQGILDLLAGSSMALEDDIETYRDIYIQLLDDITNAPSTTAVITVFADFNMASVQGVAGNMNWTIQKYCS